MALRLLATGHGCRSPAKAPTGALLHQRSVRARRRLAADGDGVASSALRWSASSSSSSLSSSRWSSTLGNRAGGLLSQTSHPMLSGSGGRREPKTMMVMPTTVLAGGTWQQVRWKRRDGNKAFDKPRPPSKKQRKAYHRKLQASQQQKERHSPPGSKAGPRREWARMMKDDLLNPQLPDTIEDEEAKALEYGIDDAVLDDLMGNTAHLSSQPTPRPVYLGHKHDLYHRQVLERKQRRMVDDPDTASNGSVVKSSAPSDRLISLALRSHRDLHGTKNRPLGLARALQYLLKDLDVPINSWGENTWTTLLTCCRTPAEGRKVLDLQHKHHKEVSGYSWSILVDLHAKMGDFEGCARVMDEMLRDGSIAPTLPAYTSLLSACARLCRNKRVAHSVRARAAKVGWDKWQELRVVGLDPDAMAYGAMLNLMAATGQPERALNLLEEMTDHFQIKPTTYCFSCALRAVARSHATAIRHERGSSPKNKRREFLTRHHGMLAREIVTRAEAAEVKQDAGFVSALILCAAAAGDAATAKAVYVASQIRNQDLWRTIGPDSHLARLRGEDPKQLLYPEELPLQILEGSGRGTSVLTGAVSTDQAHLTPLSFEEREYGRDSRVLSAILHACAQAADRNMIGAMWQGRENWGYLCDNSLRLLMARRLPRYEDTSIPGQSRTAELTWAGEHREEDYRGGNKRKARKFEGVEPVEDATDSIDDLDEMYRRIYVDDDGRLKPEFRKTTPDDIWRMKYGHDPEAMAMLDVANNRAPRVEEPVETAFQLQAPQALDVHEEELYFDNETMRWKTRTSFPEFEAEAQRTSDEASSDSDVFEADSDEPSEELVFNTDTMRWETRQRVHHAHAAAESSFEDRTTSAGVPNPTYSALDEVSEDDEELYFDDDTMRWKTRPKIPPPIAKTKKEGRTEFESRLLDLSKDQTLREDSPNTKIPQVEGLKAINEDELAHFRHELQTELAENGEDVNSVTDEEVKELFLMMKDEYKDVMSISPEDLAAALGVDDLSELDASSFEEYDEESDEETSTAESSFNTDPRSSNFQQLIEDIQDEWRAGGAELDEDNDIGSRIPTNAFAASHRELQPTQNLASSGRARHTATFDDLDLAALGIHAHEAQEANAHEVQEANQANQAGFVGDVFISDSVEQFDDVSSAEVRQTTVDDELDELRQLLPGFSDRRLRKIQKVFQRTLGDPSLLDLVPLVRERMPDYITSTWLKQASALTARYVVHKASEEGLVDVHMLNGVLEIEASSGSLDRALEFYQSEFDRQQIDRNEYSHRLILQMLVENGRFSRALALKESLVERGSPPDILSYGSMVDFCGRRRQLGSALLLLKECVHVHGAPPGEASLTALRQICRSSAQLTKDLELIVGPDPTEWLRHGEAHLKREMSKRGQRDVQLARNRLVHL